MTTNTKSDARIAEAIDAAVERFGPTITAPQFADLAHITERTAYAWRADGKGPQPWQVGGRWFYSTVDAVRYIYGAK